MTLPPLELEAAQARLLALAQPLAIERIEIASALGRYLAEPLIACRTQPAADQSAMDGYAVPHGSLSGPWQVVGESAAGRPFTGQLLSGEAVRISTGALLPSESAAVILQEDIVCTGERIELTGAAPSPAGNHIRFMGRDFRLGDALLPKGNHLGSAQLALAISAGHSKLAVFQRPQIAIIDSGDELVPDDATPAAHQIPASNGAMLAALAAALPCQIQRLGPVEDRLDALAAVLERASGADLIVTSGGASVGDHDLIRPALKAWGARIDFWRIAIKPGKPLLVAQRGHQLILGLPGNPVSSYVTAYLFMLPLIRTLLGSTSPLPRRITATLAAQLGPGGSRREFLRALWDGDSIAAHSIQDSGALSSLAHSNALIDRAAASPAAPAGTQVSAYLLENGGIA